MRSRACAAAPDPTCLLPAPAQIAVQVALVVAKIARSDYPRDWPTLVSDLLSRAQGGSTLTVRPPPARAGARRARPKGAFRRAQAHGTRAHEGCMRRRSAAGSTGRASTR
jgi:hypothetical protein